MAAFKFGFIDCRTLKYFVCDVKTYPKALCYYTEKMKAHCVSTTELVLGNLHAILQDRTINSVSILKSSRSGASRLTSLRQLETICMIRMSVLNCSEE